MILVDAGPLVAAIHRHDRNHERCVEVMRAQPGPAATAWPVVTEALYLLRFSWEAQDALWDLMARGALRLLPLDLTDVPRLRQLMQKYQDLPMDLADAALVRIAEREGIRRIFTLGRQDLNLYRPTGIGRFEIIP